MKPPGENKPRYQARNTVILAAVGAGKLGVRLFFFLSDKWNFVTESVWSLDFLPAWGMLPSHRRCSPFSCVVPQQKCPLSHWLSPRHGHSNHPPEEPAMSWQHNPPKTKISTCFKSCSARKPFICLHGWVPCKDFWSELTTASISPASLPVRSSMGCQPLNFNTILYWPWTGDRLP